MKILLTNDDGLRAPGIQAMYEALVGGERPLGEVVAAIAPLTVQSATSHGVTFHEPLMIREERLGWGGDASMTGIAVDGRPADCVKLALSTLWPERFGEGVGGSGDGMGVGASGGGGGGARPDLVISGMNAGANCGINVIYSGTVAAALEAAFLGVPAIAVSLHLGRGKPDFAAAAREARRAIERVLRSGLPEPHACLSINVPITELTGASGLPRLTVPEGGYPVRVCRMNTHGLNDRYERRVSPGGDVYFWASGHGLDFRGMETGTDVELLMTRHITVTPLRYDLTKKSVLERWRARVEG